MTSPPPISPLFAASTTAVIGGPDRAVDLGDLGAHRGAVRPAGRQRRALGVRVQALLDDAARRSAAWSSWATSAAAGRISGLPPTGVATAPRPCTSASRSE